ncbi:hypothetical protein O1R50_08620 [Glycomyces luteolus]|uniref:DUF3303 domain-containing protein n=1 Tax=Glycomyces luteolus TaxID=2670330 RepID=A0A9X3SR94_9ACTN|nr:hypothetical protein [Glycomyces luteolus]MDA1359684.1 hypothetical protein [Glycomyces luteolus]
MRMLLKVQVPADGGSQIPEDEWPKKLKEIMEQLKPEAAYFSPQDGMRTMMIFFDMKEVSMMPVVTQPMFEMLNAKISISPAMNLDDLMTGLKKAQNNR